VGITVSTEAKENDMITFNVYANGTFCGEFEAETAEDAIQKAANEFGTDGNTDGMTAEAA
jgi:hypothetical protein